MENYLIRSVLDMLEQKESKILSWGVTNGGFSEYEIEDLIDDFIQKAFPEEVLFSSEIKEELIAKHLLFRLPGPSPDNPVIFRTRSAETLRLLDSLKQILSFNRRIVQTANWRIAPKLVADFRYSLRPRLFPKRTITKQDIFERLEHNGLLNEDYKEILNDLLHSPNKDIKLASFQVDAMVQMLASVNSKYDKGMIITAGTGSGKTYCFYLPALMHIAKEMQTITKVHALAIYPRKELLKDQFTSAYKLILKIASTVRNKKKRSLSIGALFSLTPTKNEYLQEELKKKYIQNWPCPYIKCPECEGDLYWLKKDIEKDSHILTCKDQQCNHRTPYDDMLKLTRERITSYPPDILFTTTESLNRLMSDAWSYHIVGLGQEHAPDLVLLDEVHTYSGLHGAQIANLLRRWKYGAQKKVHFTGLSATLENAEKFMADMVGLATKDVVELKPREMEQIGMEYLLALRGDPVSGSALLSTTIQTIMLLRRTLEPMDSDNAMYGKKVFAFADDLDVTNRLLHNLQDAEGYVQTTGGTQSPRNLPLAVYRSTSLPEEPTRFEEGQSWRIVETIGHSLSERLRIGRTSSQDAGVDSRADVVVATASLEVGYDDDQVGVVIQHKTPRDIASFLQRKGRAGRQVNMRPWTIITLSDYGRDRITYQSYEQLFSPILPERNLPIHNKYVLRIQAALVLFDWLAFKLSQNKIKVKLWNDLANKDGDKPLSFGQKKILAIIEDLLKIHDGKYYSEFTQYLAKALQLHEDDVNTICWEQPRPLITGVLPTIHRRLKSNWKQFPEGVEVNQYPIPEYIPASLFSDLSLPEVEIILENNTDDESPTMPIEQALKEFAPGKVSRRFGVKNMQESHWIPISTQMINQELDIKDLFPRKELVGEFEYRDFQGEINRIICYRPLTIKVETLTDNNIKPSSNAFHKWRTYIDFAQAPEKSFSDVPQKTFWTRVIPKIGFFTHQSGNPLNITRFTIGSEANLSLRRSEANESSKSISFSDRDFSCALGYSLPVDGIGFLINIPKDLIQQTYCNPPLLRGQRRSFFKDSFITSSKLDGIANDFQRDWLQQAFIAALTFEVALNKLTLEEAYEKVKEKGIGEEMVNVFDVLFNVNDDGHEDRQRNHERLVDLCSNEEVISCLKELVSLLWKEPDKNFEDWVKSSFLATVGAAILDASFQLTPNFDNSEIILDIEDHKSPILSDYKNDSYDAKIWISEKTLGGGGIIESIVSQYENNPQQFFLLLESALHASDFELADSQLQEVLHLIQEQNQGVKDGIRAVREANGFGELEKAHTSLHRELQKNGILTVNTFYSALNVRVLRAGTSEKSDQLMTSLLDRWNELEGQLGLDIDARLFAYIASQLEDFQEEVQAIISAENTFGTIYGLLWPRGHVLRANAMKTYSPFQNFNPPDRLLLAPYINHQEVAVTDPDWLMKVHSWLIDRAEVTIFGGNKDSFTIKKALLILQATPVEIGVLLLYPQVSGILYENEKIKIKITLPENVY